MPTFLTNVALLLFAFSTLFYAAEWYVDVSELQQQETPQSLRGGTSSGQSPERINAEYHGLLVTTKVPAKTDEEKSKSYEQPLFEEETTSGDTDESTYREQGENHEKESTGLLTTFTTQTKEEKSKVRHEAVAAKIFDKSSYEALASHFRNTSSLCKQEKKPVTDEWMKQFPKFSIIGSHHSSRELKALLEDHPLVSPKSCGNSSRDIESQYFDAIRPSPKQVMDKHNLQAGYVDSMKNQTNKCGRKNTGERRNHSTVFFDDAPDYLFHTHMVPQLYLCAMPWAKTIAVLENPVKRAYREYGAALSQKSCTEKTFDEWVDLDISAMTRAGLLKEGISLLEEYAAYGRYLDSDSAMNGDCSFVGRGLHVIQVLHWFAALDGFGLGRDNMIVIHSNDLSGEKRQETYSKTLRFVGLDPHVLTRATYEPEAHDQSGDDKLTREKLECFFKPFNRRLYDLIGWDPVWD